MTEQQNDDAMERTNSALQHTMQSIIQTKVEMKKEHTNHSNTVEGLKESIKQTKADIVAIKDNTYAAAVEARASLAEQKLACNNDMHSKKKEIQAEIDGLKARLSKDEAIHNDKISRLENEIKELKQKTVDMETKTSSEMALTESELQLLTEEYSNNKVFLEKLEERLRVEEAEQRKIDEQEAIRLQEEANVNKLREKQHYAALWIQLRWKAFMKRKLLNQQKKGKGKGKKKGGKGKKKD